MGKADKLLRLIEEAEFKTGSFVCILDNPLIRQSDPLLMKGRFGTVRRVRGDKVDVNLNRDRHGNVIKLIGTVDVPE